MPCAIAPADAAISAQPPSNKPPCTSYVADRIGTLELPPALKIREPYSRSTGSEVKNIARPVRVCRVREDPAGVAQKLVAPATTVAGQAVDRGAAVREYEHS